MSSGEILLYIGIALIAVAVVGSIIAFGVLTVSGKRLKAQLEVEFGEKRR